VAVGGAYGYDSWIRRIWPAKLFRQHANGVLFVLIEAIRRRNLHFISVTTLTAVWQFLAIAQEVLVKKRCLGGLFW